jgi:hypothetical protein
MLLNEKYRGKLFQFSNRPLKWFDDGIDVCRFIRDGNEESEMIVNPWQCEIYDRIVLEARARIVDQQIGLL